MVTLLLVIGVFLLLFYIVGVYASDFGPEVIDEEETHNIQRRHGRASRTYLEDFATRKKLPAYYTGPKQQ